MQGKHDAVKKRRRGRRLAQDGAHFQAAEGGEQFLVIEGSGHDDGGLLCRAGLTDTPDHLDAIHARHVPVDDEQSIRLLISRRRRQFIQCLGAAIDRMAGNAERCKHVSEDFARAGAVIDDQRAQGFGQADALVSCFNTDG